MELRRKDKVELHEKMRFKGTNKASKAKDRLLGTKDMY